jgi:hypothetical protein
MSVENLLGIPQRQVKYGALCIQKLIGYPSKGGEKRSLELSINVTGYPSKAGQVWDSLYTKAYRVSLKGMSSSGHFVYKSLSGIPQKAVRKEA